MLKYILTTGLIVLCMLATYIFYEYKDQELSTPPNEVAGTNQFEIESSTIAVNIHLPFDQLSAQVNNSAPQNYSDSGNGPDQCKYIFGIRTCIGTKYEYSVSRGDISISPGSENTIHVSVPISVSGKGGFRGDGAKLLKLDAKNFRARVEIYSDITLSIGPDWCPRPTVSSNFRWLEGAKVEIISGVWIGISGLIEEKLHNQLQAMGNAVVSQIKCSNVKQEVEKIWISYSFPVEIPENKDPLYINIKPESLGFSGLQVSSGSASFALSLTVKAEVSTNPIKNTKSDLPSLQSIPFTDSYLILAVPFHIPYSEIHKLLSSKIMNKSISIDTQSGIVTVTTKRVLRGLMWS